MESRGRHERSVVCAGHVDSEESAVHSQGGMGDQGSEVVVSSPGDGACGPGTERSREAHQESRVS